MFLRSRLAALFIPHVKQLALNRYWRIVATGISYVLFGIGASLPGVYIFFLALLPMDKAAKQRKVRNAIQKLCLFYVHAMQFLGCLKYELHGHKPKNISGHLVVSNHSMLIDALFVLAYVENICCVVKASLCYNPFTRIPVKLAGYIANNDEQLIDLAVQRLEQGENVLIFPEGTRNQYDLQLDFKRGASNIAIMSNAPILPLVMCSIPRVLGKGEKWYQVPITKPHMSIIFHSVFRVSDCIDMSEPRTRQYRKFTDWLREYYLKAVSAVVGS